MTLPDRWCILLLHNFWPVIWLLWGQRAKVSWMSVTIHCQSVFTCPYNRRPCPLGRSEKNTFYHFHWIVKHGAVVRLCTVPSPSEVYALWGVENNWMIYFKLVNNVKKLKHKRLLDCHWNSKHIYIGLEETVLYVPFWVYNYFSEAVVELWVLVVLRIDIHLSLEIQH